MATRAARFLGSLIVVGCADPAPNAETDAETDAGDSSGEALESSGDDEPRPPDDATSSGPTDDDDDDHDDDDDTSGDDDDDAGTTGAAETKVPIFVAQGNIGRTLISCDDGHTWVADRAWEEEEDPLLCGSSEPVVCFESACSFLSNGECVTQEAECDCGHHPGFAKGVVYGDGAFVATWGWGHSGSVRRSTDGVVWEETLAEGVTFGGLAYGAGRFVLSNRTPMTSLDGTSWSPGGEADFQGEGGEIVWSVRRFAFSDFDGGRFVATASPPKSVLVSSDGAESWWAPSVLPDACLVNMSTYGGIASGDGVLVGVGQGGVACRSDDGGDTWTQGTVGGDNVLGHLLWTGSEFVTWGPGVRYASPDGVTWASTPLVPEGQWIGPAAYNEETGSFVAVARVWDGYDAQTFLRSDDGVSWEALDSGAGPGGHPVFAMTFGWADPSNVCPGS